MILSGSAVHVNGLGSWFVSATKRLSWVIVPARPFFIGRPGWVRSSAWICDFSSTERTMAWAGGSSIKPDNITPLVDELRVVGELELVDPVRLETMRAPDALDGTRADTDGFRHHSSSPMGRLGGRIGPGERHNTLGDIRAEWWDA